MSSALHLPRNPTPDLVSIVREALDHTPANRFAAGAELNDRGIPTPNGEATWTAVLIDRVLREA